MKANSTDGPHSAAIRPLTHDDLDALLRLYPHLHTNDTPLPDRKTIERVWSQALAMPGSRYYGAFDGSLLVAACAITIIPNLTRGCRPYAVIENVVTHGDYRRQGWGRAVMLAALDFAWSQRCYKVMLLTGRKDEQCGGSTRVSASIATTRSRSWRGRRRDRESRLPRRSPRRPHGAAPQPRPE